MPNGNPTRVDANSASQASGQTAAPKTSVRRQPTSRKPATRKSARKAKTYGRSASVPMTRSIRVAFGSRVTMLPSGVVTVFDDAIARAQAYLLAHQAPDGHWIEIGRARVGKEWRSRWSTKHQNE